MQENPELFAARIDLLEKFAIDLRTWLSPQPDDYAQRFAPNKHADQQVAAERSILRNKRAVAQAIADAGVPTTIVVTAPAVVGGGSQRLDVIENVFELLYQTRVASRALRAVEEAIGVYEHLRDETGLVRLIYNREGLDVVDAIERALRPAFRAGPPKRERDVQDQVETILNSLGVVFTREQETAPVGPRASIPDFVLTDQGMALEVKFAHERHTDSQVQEEIMADVSAYKTKWKHLLFVVYDVGAISDPAKMRQDNAKQFGVTVLVVKH